MNEALVKIEPNGAVHGMTPFLLPHAKSSSFERVKSRAWQVRCCWDFFKGNIPSWLASLQADRNSFVLGEKNLGNLLLEEIRLASEGGDRVGTGVARTPNKSSSPPLQAEHVKASHQHEATRESTTGLSESER